MPKVYTSGNYFFLDFEVPGEDVLLDAKQKVYVSPINDTGTTYLIKSDELGTHEFEISEITKENGDAYSQSDFESFFLNNTGSSSDKLRYLDWDASSDGSTIILTQSIFDNYDVIRLTGVVSILVPAGIVIGSYLSARTEDTEDKTLSGDTGVTVVGDGTIINVQHNTCLIQVQRDNEVHVEGTDN